ncbi:MAG TPA: hypothetical protein VF491_17560 [Vicinamibacterales bacterium]
MKIIAKVTFSEQLKAGDSYELPESDAKMLIAAGLVVAADAEPVRATRSRQYARRDMQAEQTS